MWSSNIPRSAEGALHPEIQESSKTKKQSSYNAGLSKIENHETEAELLAHERT
jgi:hypothetical protein